MLVKIKKLHPDAQIPKYATAGAACFDLHSVGNSETMLYWGMSKIFRTGLAFEIPQGFVMLVYSRSGHGFKNDVRLANCVGIIDSDFRGEIVAKLTRDNSGSEYLTINPGDRIAQAMIIPSYKAALAFVDELSETVRGSGGFGSTGA